MGARNVVQLRVALGVLVHQLRLKHGLSIAELARSAQISEDELRQVEHDPHYTARPRVSSTNCLSILVFRCRTLSQMSGTTHAVDPNALQHCSKIRSAVR